MTSRRTRVLSDLPFLVSLACACLPFAAVHLAYVLAASHGYVDWCNPYIDSCTSISATGRRPPARFVFKGIMLPAAALIMIYWWITWRWVTRAMGRRSSSDWMLGLGVVACIGLILYVVVLGEVGDWLRLQRKIGTILFFSFTFLAQLLFAAELRRYGIGDDLRARDQIQRIGRWMLRVCALMLALGIGSVIVDLLNDSWHDAIEDALEWQLALLLQLNFCFGAWHWRQVNWELRFEALS